MPVCAQAASLLFSGATLRSGLLAELYATPDGTIILNRELRSETARLAFDDNDVVLLDLTTDTYSLFADSQPYDILINEVRFARADLIQRVAVQPPGSGLFLVDQNRTAINSIGAVVYTGSLNPSMHRFVVSTAPAPPDFDEDGLPDAVEAALGLNATIDDTDRNGILDAFEDSDGDGVSNAEELAAGTDPGNMLDSPASQCSLGTHDCDINASCSVTTDSFSCTCDAGFLGDGNSCEVDDGSITTLRASVQASGLEWSDSSDSPSISIDGGYVAYANFDTGATNCFVRTPQGNQIQVNISDPALSGPGFIPTQCFTPATSRFGEAVAFIGIGNSLLEDSSVNLEGTNAYLRITGSKVGDLPVVPAQTILVSRNSNVSEPSSVNSIAISDNGRFVVFDAFGDGYVPNDINNAVDVFLFDRVLQTTELVSVPTGAALSGQQAFNGSSSADGASVTDDGRFIAFTSDALGLDPDVIVSGVSNVYLRDRLNDTTTLISRGAVPNTPADDGSFFARMSATGRFITFESTATNLIGDDTNGDRDVFVHDTELGTTTRVSTSDSGEQLPGRSSDPDISADGRFVTFRSRLDGQVFSSVVLKDTLTQSLQLINHTPTNPFVAATLEGNSAGAFSPSMSGSGNEIAYSSAADTILPVGVDTNSATDIFVRTKGRTALLPHNEWQLISLPAVPPPSRNTVNDIFGDDIPTTYGDASSGWIIFAHDAPTNTYSALQLTDTLIQGDAYWIIQLSGVDLTVDMPGGSTQTPSTAAATCTAPLSHGCFERPLELNSPDFTWNAMGNPFYTTPSLNDMRVRTASGDCADADGCTPAEAADQNEANVQHNEYFSFVSDAVGYLTLRPGDTWQPWTGYWSPVLQGADENDAVLVVPRL